MQHSREKIGGPGVKHDTDNSSGHCWNSNSCLLTDARPLDVGAAHFRPNILLSMFGAVDTTHLCSQQACVDNRRVSTQQNGAK